MIEEIVQFDCPFCSTINRVAFPSCGKIGCETILPSPEIEMGCDIVNKQVKCESCGMMIQFYSESYVVVGYAPEEITKWREELKKKKEAKYELR